MSEPSQLTIPSKRLSLFQAAGVELEYMIVDRNSLDVKPITNQVFQHLGTKGEREITRGPISINNELALHVIEFKATRPTRDIQGLLPHFHKELNALNGTLSAFQGKLLSGAMHPWMDPFKEMRLWADEDAQIYNTFNRIFDCRGHGWANLQSAHLNLPFANDEEFSRLHSAVRVLLPLIPALAASSPFADGKYHDVKDFRLRAYRNNSRKYFSITANVIPEVCHSQDEYRRVILEPIYRDMEKDDPEGILRDEWINARGAIARFHRYAVEIRLIDVQETPAMDLAILETFFQLAKALVDESWADQADYDSFSSERLRDILDQMITGAEDTLIADQDYLKLFGWKQNAPCTAHTLWRHILQTGRLDLTQAAEKQIGFILKHGTLATRLLKGVGKEVSKPNLKRVYDKLSHSLVNDQPYLP